MYLRVLGTLAFDLADRPASGAAAQRRPLALLAALAAAGERGVTRERLQLLFWPESDAERARGALNQTLYALRRDAGARDLVTGGAVLTLSPASLRCDLWAFEQAADAGDVDAALAVYGGPFLDGVLLPRAAEFERWAEGERSRVAGRLARLLADGAAAAVAAGDHARAAALWERRVAADPVDAAATVAWMRALVAVGDRRAALRAAARHAAEMRAELGAGPAAEVAEYAAEVERAAERTATPTEAPRHEGPRPAVSETPDVTPAVTPARPRPAAPNAQPGPRPLAARRVRGRRTAGAAALVLGACAVGAGAWAWRSGTGASAEARLADAARAPARDPRRIAVLYFDDHSPGRTLGYLADGLTEYLIDQLAQVPALRVVFRNGVKPCRDRPAACDSVVRALEVGTVVEGSVQRSAGRTRVTVQLVDAASGTHLGSNTFDRPDAELFALQDDITRQVAFFLRRRLGDEVEVRAARAERADQRALDLLLRAERERKDAEALGAFPRAVDRGAATAALARADALLAAAEQVDPRWVRAPVLRGRALLHRALLDSGTVREAWVRGALAAAERALALDPESAAAFDLRGTARWQAVRLYNDAGHDTKLAASAEADLRRAVDLDSASAGAWATLSALQRWGGKTAEAERSARRALAADAYLEQAGDVYAHLYLGAMALGAADTAWAWCARGRAAVPNDVAVAECELTLMRLDLATGARPRPNPDRAWVVARALDRLDPPSAAREAGRPYQAIFRRMTVAGVVAASGLHDSARALLARARAEVAGDPTTRVDLLRDEAFVYLTLRDRARATAALRAFLAARPERRPAAVRDPVLLGLGLDTVALHFPTRDSADHRAGGRTAPLP